MSEQLTGGATDTRTETETVPNGTWLKVGGLTATTASLIGSLVGYALLPARMRIHWSLGGPYYGPEFAPTWVVLVLFPLLVGGVAFGSYWLGTRVRSGEEFATVRPLMTLVPVIMLVLLVVTEASLIVVNL